MVNVAAGMAQAQRRGIDPYASGMLGGGKPVLKTRVPVRARVVAVLTSRRETRGLELIHPWTRGVRRHEVHELLLTDEQDARPGRRVDRIAAIAFVEFTEGGLVVGGDRVVIGGIEVGALIGYDETHCPNHMNIVLRGPDRKTGEQLGIRGGDTVEFVITEKD